MLHSPIKFYWGHSREEEVIAAAEECLQRLHVVSIKEDMAIAFVLMNVSLMLRMLCLQVLCSSSFSFLASLKTCSALLDKLQVLIIPAF